MVKILQVTDLHILPKADGTLLGVSTEQYFELVLQHAHRHHERFDLMLLTGDLAQDPCRESYQRIRRILSHYDTPCICLPGNHDDFVMMREILAPAPVGCERRRRLGDWQIICLNSQREGSPAGLLAPDELNYLGAQLRLHPDLHTLIAVHHHCIPSDSSWMDTMMIANSDELFARIANHPNVKAIICGHVHQVLEKKRNGVQLLGTPASCFQFLPGCRQFALDHKPPGYRVLELAADGGVNSEVTWLPINLDELDFSSTGY